MVAVRASCHSNCRLNSRSNCLYPRTSCLRRTGQKTWYRTREVLPEEVELELELLEEPLDELLEDPFEELFSRRS